MLHVTDILDAYTMTDTTWLTPDGRDRGALVHEAIALDIRGDLDESSVAPDVAPFLASWRRYQRESRIRVIASELDITHKLFGYCGRVDLVAELPDVTRPIVIDFKTGGVLPSVQLQLAGYALAYQLEHGGATPLRAGLYLKADGRAGQLFQFEDRTDLDVWRGLVAAAHFKVRHGLWAPKLREVSAA